MWWPSEQAATPRRRRTDAVNEPVDSTDTDWQPRARSRKGSTAQAEIIDVNVVEVGRQTYPSPAGWNDPVGWIETPVRTAQYEPVQQPIKSDLPAVRTSTAVERFDISQALHVEEDHTIDPLAPNVTVVTRFAWKKLARNVAIVFVASAVILIGFTVLNQRGASSRLLTVRAATVRALGSETLTAQLRYVSDGGTYVGTVDAQRDPVVQHFSVTEAPTGNSTTSSTFESIWIRGDLYVRSPKSAAGLGDKWVVVHRAASRDMRARINMSAVLAIRAPEPLLPLRVIAKHVESAKEAGSDTINGVRATHYIATIDTNKIRSGDTLDDVRLTVKHFGWIGLTDADIWIDQAGEIVKLELPFDTTGRLTMTIQGGTGKLSAEVPAEAADASTLPEFVAVLDGATS
jgi:predicted small integral membrane protein